jgi:hypothetical protein
MDEAADFVAFEPSAFRCLTHLTFFLGPLKEQLNNELKLTKYVSI